MSISAKTEIFSTEPYLCEVGDKMILDGHMHILENGNREEFYHKMKSIGVDGGIIISMPPASFKKNGNECIEAEDRLNNLFFWQGGQSNLYPFFWIDPTEDDADQQVKLAVESGIQGFKVICTHFYPKDERAMRIFKMIRDLDKPILFHSGILWNKGNLSAYSKPIEFEILEEIIGLRFCLAHISWPWCDELIAVYGKFLKLYTDQNMYIDLTPGTPGIYRKDAFTKLFNCGINVNNNIIFGSDAKAHNYDADYVKSIINMDDKFYDANPALCNIKSKVYCKNLLRFIGIDKSELIK